MNNVIDIIKLFYNLKFNCINNTNNFDGRVDELYKIDLEIDSFKEDNISNILGKSEKLTTKADSYYNGCGTEKNEIVINEQVQKIIFQSEEPNYLTELAKKTSSEKKTYNESLLQKYTIGIQILKANIIRMFTYWLKNKDMIITKMRENNDFEKFLILKKITDPTKILFNHFCYYIVFITKNGSFMGQNYIKSYFTYEQKILNNPKNIINGKKRNFQSLILDENSLEQTWGPFNEIKSYIAPPTNKYLLLSLKRFYIDSNNNS